MLVYDGDCGFCTASARWIARKWPTGRARIAAWQELGPAGTGALGLGPEQVRDAAWWVDPGGRTHGGHRAVGRALEAAGGGWGLLGRLLLLRPLDPVAAWAYGAVARHRHRLPGATPACAAARASGGVSGGSA